MRGKAYRRTAEKLTLARRKVITNIVKRWNLTDEQIKVGLDYTVNWMSNEWWTDFNKKKCNRKRCHEQKNNINKELWK